MDWVDVIRVATERAFLAKNRRSKTALCGILLHPAGHTRSPAMHNAAFAACGLDAVYHAFDVRPSRLPAAIRAARELNIQQLAISIPHKESVLEHLDHVDETAVSIGAVNTVTLKGDQLIGHNTDWSGALKALQRKIEPKGQRAVVLGAGGTARALTYGLIREGAEVFVLNRTESRAAELSKHFGAQGSGSLDDLGDLNPQIIVNTTSVGLRSHTSPVSEQAIGAGCVVMDAVYEPEVTRLLSEAEAQGAQTLSGKWMLIHQAAEQFHLWTQLEAPLEVMSEAFDRAGSNGHSSNLTGPSLG